MKKIIVLSCCIFLGITHGHAQQVQKISKKSDNASLYDYTVTDLNGTSFPLRNLKGKKVLIVNTASKCGYTSQYKELEELYEKYKNDNFVIVGFPSNDFGGQEPGSNKEIAQFCTKNYGVTFPMMEKSSVTGKEMNDVYKYLTQKDKNGVQDSTVEWNFQKYLIDESGKLVMVFKSKISPMNEEIVNWVKAKK